MAEGANMEANSGAQAAPQYVTAEQLNQFSEKIGNDMKAMFGRVPSLIADQVAQIAPKTAQHTGGAQPVNATEEVARLMKAEREELAKEKQVIQKQRIRGAIETTLIEHGANPSAVKLATDSLMMRNAENISIKSDADTGETAVVYKKDQYAEPLPMSEFIKSFLQGDEGRAIVAPKSAPSTNGVPRGVVAPAGEVIKMTRAQMATADPKLLKSGRVVAID